MRSSSVATTERSWSVDGVRAIRIGVTCGPGMEGVAAIDGREDAVDFDAQKPGMVRPRCLANWAEGWVVLVGTTTCDVPGAGTGGSAMPWGLVLPAVRAKLVDGESDPEERLRALSNW
jgi:hypothetical protein